MTTPALPTIHQALAAVMSDMGAIGKNGKNVQQGYKFRGIEDVYNVLHPIFAKHGVTTVPTVVGREFHERTTKSGSANYHTVLTVEFAFIGPAGDFVTAKVIGEGMDTGDKSSNKAMTAAHKYALVQTLCIAFAEVEDADRTSPEETKGRISDVDLSSKAAPVSDPTALKKAVKTAPSISKLAQLWREMSPEMQAELKDAFSERKDEIKGEVAAE